MAANLTVKNIPPFSPVKGFSDTLTFLLLTQCSSLWPVLIYDDTILIRFSLSVYLLCSSLCHGVCIRNIKTLLKNKHIVNFNGYEALFFTGFLSYYLKKDLINNYLHMFGKLWNSFNVTLGANGIKSAVFALMMAAIDSYWSLPRSLYTHLFRYLSWRVCRTVRPMWE